MHNVLKLALVFGGVAFITKSLLDGYEKELADSEQHKKNVSPEPSTKERPTAQIIPWPKKN